MPVLNTKMEPDVPPPSLPELIERKDYAAVASHCEELQLQAAMHGAAHPLFSAHLFSLLLQDRLPAARFLMLQRKTRSPPAADAEAAAIRVGEALWKRNTASFFEAVRAFSWDAGMQPLAIALERVTRDRVFSLLATVYSCVHVDVVASKLGIQPALARSECTARGWTPLGPGEDAHFLRPPPAEPREAASLGDPASKVSLLADQLVRMQTSA